MLQSASFFAEIGFMQFLQKSFCSAMVSDCAPTAAALPSRESNFVNLLT
jgi:hypothetical protein